MGDAGKRGAMHSGSQSDRGGSGGVDTDIRPTVASATEAIERQLTDALDAAESPQTKFHIRQALQLAKALDE